MVSQEGGCEKYLVKVKLRRAEEGVMTVLCMAGLCGL